MEFLNGIRAGFWQLQTDLTGQAGLTWALRWCQQAVPVADDKASWRLTIIGCPVSLRAPMGTSCESGEWNPGVRGRKAGEGKAEWVSTAIPDPLAHLPLGG